MRKFDFPSLITQSLDQLREQERRQSSAKVRLRITLLRLLKSGEAQFIKDACRILGISSKHGYQLWNWYKAKDFEQYLRLNYRPGEGKLSSQQKALLIEKASDGRGFASQQEVRRFLKEEFQVSYTQAGVCLLFQRLKIKAKQPRPSNVKADKQAQAEFKKTSAKE